MTNKEIKESIENVKATLAIENLNINKLNIINGEKYLKGQITSQEAIENITKYIKSRQLKQ
ncbi:antitoxin VbhA family protein [Natroniella sp. ANB-PHB2]|uniref:antitoxin VbhA family protein n=1 Tax=Natroniella sp. ANB-PHB2 TaxID=3384444 RepID=UPI0038D493A4